VRFLLSSAAVICALAFGACGDPQYASHVPAQLQRSMAPHPQATATPIAFSFKTIDDPYSDVNKVTGTNDLGKIVGVFQGGSASNIPESYTSEPPYTKFKTTNYPGAQGTDATTVTRGGISGGFVIDPGSKRAIVGFVRAGSQWTLFSDGNEGTGKNAVTEILGINDSQSAVGFYTNSSGTSVPFQLDVATQTFTDLNPPGAIDAEATGINANGNIAGWETTTSGVVGFLLKAGAYVPLSYPGAHGTYATSLNRQNQIAGYYLSGSGKAHGFIVTSPTRNKPTWQKVDEPKAASGTWITGINEYDDICGYYVDAAGIQHGFLAVPK
jgi:hypothetical protein